MTNDQPYVLLKNRNPKIRFAAINLLYDRDHQQTFKKDVKLLAKIPALYAMHRTCANRTPLDTHLKFLGKQKDR